MKTIKIFNTILLIATLFFSNINIANGLSASSVFNPETQTTSDDAIINEFLKTIETIYTKPTIDSNLNTLNTKLTTFFNEQKQDTNKTKEQKNIYSEILRILTKPQIKKINDKLYKIQPVTELNKWISQNDDRWNSIEDTTYIYHGTGSLVEILENGRLESFSTKKSAFSTKKSLMPKLYFGYTFTNSEPYATNRFTNIHTTSNQTVHSILRLKKDPSRNYKDIGISSATGCYLENASYSLLDWLKDIIFYNQKDVDSFMSHLSQNPNNDISEILDRVKLFCYHYYPLRITENLEEFKKSIRKNKENLLNDIDFLTFITIILTNISFYKEKNIEVLKHIFDKSMQIVDKKQNPQTLENILKKNFFTIDLLLNLSFEPIRPKIKFFNKLVEKCCNNNETKKILKEILEYHKYLETNSLVTLPIYYENREQYGTTFEKKAKEYIKDAIKKTKKRSTQKIKKALKTLMQTNKQKQDQSLEIIKEIDITINGIKLSENIYTFSAATYNKIIQNNKKPAELELFKKINSNEYTFNLKEIMIELSKKELTEEEKTEEIANIVEAVMLLKEKA